MQRAGTDLVQARVTQVMALLDLPDDVKERLLAEGDEVRGMSIREALRTARTATG